ncbi:ribonuclease III [Alistipes sp. OttesenSCG-928-L06]|nr:ribonuclease III [Alistipes sp. OttesenSCG-928-L06]
MFKRILLRFRKDYRQDERYYKILNDIFGLTPNNIELYKLALIHRSASVYMEEGGIPVNNERLEFLGDAILEAIVSDYLFIEFPDKSEGFLTQIRSKIVSRASLNEIAVKIGLDKHVIVQYSNNHIQKHLYGDALEAMIGAIYLDKGYDFVNRLVINDILGKNLSLDQITQIETDFKSRLIEWCQKHKLKVVFDTMPSADYHDHTPSFTCQIVVAAEPLGKGKGLSKKEAEQHAAHESMSAIRKNKELRDRLIALHTPAPAAESAAEAAPDCLPAAESTPDCPPEVEETGEITATSDETSLA